MAFVDEKVESTLGHGLLHDLRDATEGGTCHCAGFFMQVGDGVQRPCSHGTLFLHACLELFWLSAYLSVARHAFR